MFLLLINVSSANMMICSYNFTEFLVVLLYVHCVSCNTSFQTLSDFLWSPRNVKPS